MTYQNLNLMEQKELEDLRHKNKMAELEYFRGTERFKHDLELERHRIINADKKRYLAQKILLAKQRR